MSGNLLLRESTGEIQTNYTRKYAQTRGWKTWEVVREITQNALDSANSVSIERTPEGLLISDKGTGFFALNLLMGTTSKSPCHRGRFGEGLKIAALAALDIGLQMDIFTDSMHIVPMFKTLEIVEPSGGTVTAEIMVFKYEKIPPVTGTRILLKGYPSDVPDYRDRFNLVSNKKIVLKGNLDVCEEKTYPSYIIDEPVKRLYVRNIYVQDITEKIAIFSYDLFSVKLSTDRNIPSSGDINKQIGKLWSAVTNQKMIEAFLKNVKEEGFESEAWLNSSIILKFGSKLAWVNAFHTVFGAATFLSTNDESTRLAEYHSQFIKKGVTLPAGIRTTLNALGIPYDIDVLHDIKKVMPRLQTSLSKTREANLEYLKMLHHRIEDKYPFGAEKIRAKVFAATKETMRDDLGKVIDSNIYIREDQMETMTAAIMVYGHELTHIAFEELKDNTSSFYAKIGLVMATITKVAMQEGIKPPSGVMW